MSGRRAAPGEDVESFLGEHPQAIQEVARTLRRTVLEEVPDAVEKQHGGWRVVGYSWDGSMKTSICAIAPHGAHVNLQFFYGAGLPDPSGLLEGTGKHARHVELRDPEACGRDELRELIRAAAERARPVDDV